MRVTRHQGFRTGQDRVMGEGLNGVWCPDPPRHVSGLESHSVSPEPGNPPQEGPSLPSPDRRQSPVYVVVSPVTGD